MIPLHKFYNDGMVRARDTKERYGQAMFNHLHEVQPELAEKVRGTEMDPFYCSSGSVKDLIRPNDSRWDRFVQFIETNWYL